MADGGFTSHERWQISSRLRSHWLRAVAAVDPRSLLVPAASVLTLATAEAVLLSRRGVWRSHPRFVLSYARQQLAPSIVWATKPAEQVAAKLGLAPAELLRVCDAATADGASRLLRVQTLQTARSIIAGFVGIAQILRLADLVSEAESDHVERVMAGREPMLSGVEGRVVRLSGLTSDVTELTAQRIGSHIIPIIEDPAQVAAMIKTHSCDGQRPFAWQVPNKACECSNSLSPRYRLTSGCCNTDGRSASWGAASPSKADLAEAAFQMDRQWLYPIAPQGPSSTEASADPAQGRKVLILEADSSVGEQALALSSEPDSNDVSVQEASQGFFMLEEIARAQGVLLEGDRVARVLLADSDMPIPTGGGGSYTQRQRCDEQDDADVFIDAQRPLIIAILDWAKATHLAAERASGTKLPRQIVFDTTNRTYFSTVKSTLARHGWQVVDRPATTDRATHGRTEKRALEVRRQLPRLLYFSNSQDTVNELRSLVAAGATDATLACALLDSHEVTHSLGAVAASASIDGPIQYICSAQLYDGLLSEVRGAICAGESFAAIQDRLDRRFQL